MDLICVLRAVVACACIVKQSYQLIRRDRIFVNHATVVTHELAADEREGVDRTVLALQVLEVRLIVGVEHWLHHLSVADAKRVEALAREVGARTRAEPEDYDRLAFDQLPHLRNRSIGGSLRAVDDINGSSLLQCKEQELQHQEHLAGGQCYSSADR